MLEGIVSHHETIFLVNLLVVMICGVLIGGERELRGKPAGLSTQTLVMVGAMLFTFLSHSTMGPDPTRIAAQIVSGIGFLGAGVILFSKEHHKLENVTTASTIWLSAAVGMAIGFGYRFIPIVCALFAVGVARLPKFGKDHSENSGQ